jgi:hypothetical protein
MKKLLLFAAVAGLGLVSASPPDKGPDNGPRDVRRHYPPCSRTVTDRCIQLYERGRHERRGEARDEHRGHHDEMAQDDHGDRRWCREHHARHGGHHGRAMATRRTVRRVVMTARVTRVVAAAPRRQVAQRVRRAGERG